MKTKNYSGIRNSGPLPSPQDVEVPGDIGDLLSDYVESTSSMLNELEEATLAYEAGSNRAENAAVVRRVLHKIKGESSMVGIEDMSELCHQTEYAFEELTESQRPEMLLRFKDWAWAAIQNMTA
jgi:chemotaxis protein histidine kinase CheA